MKGRNLYFLLTLLCVIGARGQQVFSVENDAVARYMAEVSYEGATYDHSQVRKYAELSTTYPKERPFAAKITWERAKKAVNYEVIVAKDSAFSQIVRTFSLSSDDQSINVYHLLPGMTYYYKVTSQNFKGETSELRRDSLRIDGQVRMLHLPSLHNVRDLGGWSVKGGRHVRYGLLYRGGEMNGEHFIQISDADVAELRQHVGIRAELDLRSPDELDLTPSPDDDITSSALGSDISYRRVSIQPYVKIDSLRHLYKECFDYILSCLRQGYPVYFHCWGGADRTGTLAFLLCGLLGVSQSDLDKDYELTSFCDITGLRVRHSNRYAYKAMIELLERQYSGHTLQDKIRNYFLKAGVSRHDIAEFQRFMLSE